MMRDRLESGPPETPKRGLEPGRTMRAAIAHELGQERPGVDPTAPPTISDHELLHRIGSGAYGDVWLARNALGTLRAVKIVYRACFEEERPYQREFNGILKYEPISRTHPGLMQVLHVGHNDSAGFFYYVMELADAVPADCESCGLGTGTGPVSRGIASQAFRPRTLRTEHAKGVRLAPLEAARVTLKLAEALSHLHAHGLVHRDIKPANVIFVGGQPKLADIGLVASVGDSRSFVGTEGYIPPEGPGTVQADLYSLGKLLYELATGRDRLEFPQLPAELRELPEREALLDLNEIITRACAPEPKNRYATAPRFEADLQLFIAGSSLRAARRVERHLAWLRALAGAALLLLLVGGGVVWISKSNERQALRRARAEASLRARAEAAEQAFQGQLYAALLEQARATVGSRGVGQRIRSLDAVRRAAAITNTPELRQAALAALALPDLRFEHEIPVSQDYMLAELDPAFERLALCKGNGPIEIRTVPDRRLLATLPASSDSPAYVATWSSDGRFLGVKRNRSGGGDQSDVEIWDVKNSRRVVQVRDAGYGTFSFHPRLPRVLGSCGGAAAAIWDLETGKQLAKFSLASNPIWLPISPDGRRFASATRTNASWSVSIHRIDDGELITSSAASDFVGSLDWHPDGRWLGVGDFSGAVYLLDSTTGAQRVLGRHKVQAVMTRFSPDGTCLLSGGWERELIFWDLSRMERAFTLRLGSFSARFKADGRECAVGTRSGWQIHSFEKPASDRELPEDLGGRVAFAAFSPDGDWLAASGSANLGVWDLAQPGPGALADAGAFCRPLFGADGQLFASGDNGAFRWRTRRAAGKGVAPILESVPVSMPTGLVSICLSSNRLAWTSSRGSRLTDLDPAKDDGNWAATPQGVNGASPDGRWLAIFQPFTPRLYVYQSPGFELVRTITCNGNVRGFAFSPSGEQLAIGTPERVQFWRTSDWRLLREVDHCHDALFCPHEPAVWLTRDFSEAGLYDLRTLKLLIPLPTGWLPLALSQDGRRLALSVDGQRVQVWDLRRMREEMRALGLDWPGNDAR